MVVFMLKYLLLFVSGSIIGWCTEVVYRRYLGKARKWINPGFLSGPFLPIYGTGICLLYIICDLEIIMVVRVILFFIMTTCVEYTTGLIFLKYYKTRLWDYTTVKFNIQGIISPAFSIIWVVLSVLFYYLLYPVFYSKIEFVYMHLESSLFIGIFIGIILVDMTNSFNVVNKLRLFAEAAEDSRIVFNYEQLKIEIREKFVVLSNRIEGLEENIESRISTKLKLFLRKRQKPTFMLPFRGDNQLSYRLQEHINGIKSRKRETKDD